MADKVELTKEQLTELTGYFKQNDFTKNMMLDRGYNLNLEESKVFIKVKEFFGELAWQFKITRRKAGYEKLFKKLSRQFPRKRGRRLYRSKRCRDLF